MWRTLVERGAVSSCAASNGLCPLFHAAEAFQNAEHGRRVSEDQSTGREPTCKEALPTILGALTPATASANHQPKAHSFGVQMDTRPLVVSISQHSVSLLLISDVFVVEPRAGLPAMTTPRIDKRSTTQKLHGSTLLIHKLPEA